MAKRKRLEVPAEPFSPLLETKSAFPPAPRARMPIAEVAGETAGRAALEEVAREMTAAEEEGRVVRKIPLAGIDHAHLARDRIAFGAEEMETLRRSIAARGQQTPIEVVALGDGRYGLISGLRRLIALRDLEATHILALVRRPETAQAAYQAMVEENEVRSDLSFYERAHVAVAAAGLGLYPDARAAVAGLFPHVSKTKRSKIVSFVTLVEMLDGLVSFPAAIPEKLGLDLVRVLSADKVRHDRLRDALRKRPPQTPEAERKTLEAALKSSPAARSAAASEIVRGVRLERKRGRAVLSGPGVDADFLQALERWLVSRAKPGISSL